jgi:hypothetical protein
MVKTHLEVGLEDEIDDLVVADDGEHGLDDEGARAAGTAAAAAKVLDLEAVDKYSSGSITLGLSYLWFFSRGVLRYFTQTWRNKSFQCLLRRLPRPQDVSHLRLRYCKFFNPFYYLNCCARERAPDAGLQKRATFPH